jgi:glycosyltransferase involved in cell wall biosynthesis
LEDYKRVDMIVKAFLRMPDKKLIVTSGGSELAHLKRIADNAPNIVFTGWVNEDRLRELVGRAIATIYVPIDEDFGMSPVESMAAGKPVIGVAEGGMLETVVQAETGTLIPGELSPEKVAHAVHKLTPARALEMREVCENRAAAFHPDRFIAGVKAFLK